MRHDRTYVFKVGAVILDSFDNVSVATYQCHRATNVALSAHVSSSPSSSSSSSSSFMVASVGSASAVLVLGASSATDSVSLSAGKGAK